MIFTLDNAILDFVRNNLTSYISDRIMLFITSLGNFGAIWIMSALIFIAIKKHRELGVAMMLSLIIALLVGNIILKPIVHRNRPFVNESQIDVLVEPTDYSFPSGHAFSSFAAAITILCYKKRWGILAIVLASSIAFSRIYLYVHYPSDVLTGLVLGIGAGIASYKLIANQKFFRRAKHGNIT